MFYDIQPDEHKENYKRMLTIVGKLSRLFSTSEAPYLYYRAHENIFAKYFDVDNNARHDDSADAYSIEHGIGIGLKTWVGQDNQKVAEFGRLRPTYAGLNGMDLIQRIAEYRNTRIRTTLNAHGLQEMIYHIVKRVPGMMQIYESAFDYIDREHIVLDENRGNDNSIYFSDGNHTYHFNKSKSTLYMIFEDMELLDEFEVEIVDDPYELLEMVFDEDEEADADVVYNREPRITRAFTERITRYRQLCLRLYATDRNGQKYVPERSGLNQWNANGRARDVNEVYIPYLKEDRERGQDFFPPRDTPFTLILPDGTEISAKVCQRAYRKLSDSEYENLSEEEKRIEDEKTLVGKSIMSNPNKILGEWLLRDVLQIEEGTVITYDMLRVYNIDCVVFTKISDRTYRIDFGELGTYERFYGLEDAEAEYDVE